ncbi:hypothetical protein CDAR_309011 [Caerostris darwini]|uniref:Uncharacterized protein n=1 Tax=Caerostris darwini TaxID=1538125 RepID=A0AAV4U5S8_9ARAC|nr:hypothetical protein CDAR_309011 [Caerostris darwini]
MTDETHLTEKEKFRRQTPRRICRREGESSPFKRGAVPVGDRHHPRHGPGPTREEASVRRPLPKSPATPGEEARQCREIMMMVRCRLPRE